MSYLTTVGAFAPFHVCEELAQDADEGGDPNVAPLEGTLHAQPGDKPTRVQFRCHGVTFDSRGRVQPFHSMTSRSIHKS